MEWRIILPVLCLIGILHLPGYAVAQDSGNSTVAPNVTSPSHSTGNDTSSTAVVSTVAVTILNSSVTGAGTTIVPTAPAKVGKIALVFSLIMEFKDAYSNLSNPESKELIHNITSQCEPVYKKHFPNFIRMVIKKFSKGSIVTESELEFDTTSTTSPNATDVKETFVSAINSGNFTFAANSSSITADQVTDSSNGTNTTVSMNTTTALTTTATSPVNYNITVPAKVGKIAVVFRLIMEFKDAYSNLSHPETIVLINNITSQCKPVYKKRFPNFFRMVIKKFSKGSVVTESDLEFDITSTTSPNATDVKDTFVSAISSGNFTFGANSSSITADQVTDSSNGANTTVSSNVTTSSTTSPVNYNITAPAKVGKIALVFSLIMEFKDAYSNLSNHESKELINNITSQCEPVYKKRFANFFRMVIKKFSNGSVVTESELEFDTTNSTSPNATDVKDTFLEAIKNGNFSFKVDNSTITAQQITESSNGTNTTVSTNTTIQTTPSTTSPDPVNYNITFKMSGLFTTALSNSNSPEYNSLGNFTVSQLDGFYKNVRGFINSFIRRFRNGSIIVDAGLRFDKNINSPNASFLAKELAAAVRNQTILLQIDPASINVTNPTGSETANSKSPVLASMLTALCMTVASLLFSAVMH